MRIIIDMQGAQTESANRGIGRYSLSLAKALFENAGKHEIFFFFNKKIGLKTNQLLMDFIDEIPSDRILVWDFDEESHNYIKNEEQSREAKAFSREAFINRFRPDLLHICSPFEGNEVTYGVKEFLSNLLTTATLYDLIPLVHGEVYLSVPEVKTWYLSRLSELEKTDALLAISDSSTKEGIELLNKSEDKIKNVGCSVDLIFEKSNISNNPLGIAQKLKNINYEYVLVPSGNDSRKNLERAVEAFSRLPTEIRQKYKLVFGRDVEYGIPRKYIKYCYSKSA